MKKLLFLLFIIIWSFAFISSFSSQTSSQTLTNAERSTPCTFYKWFDPNTNEKEGKLLLKNCSSCHMAYYNEWINDKHAMSQNNLFFLSIYKQFKQDHPNQNGNCALCHNPEAALDNNFDVTLTETKSKKTNGISCDFCHKIESIDQNPLKKGVAGFNILRTCKGEKDIRFGPLKDPLQVSDREELKYNSLFKTSLSCAKCHDGSNGNVQIYSTFTEWLNSPAAKKGVQCQSCHMAPRKETGMGGGGEGKFEIVDNPVKVIHELPQHKERPYYQIHSHRFLTEDPSGFRKKYVNLKVKTPQWGVSTGRKTLQLEVIVENNNFGHSFPTGSPMRNAILLVEAKDKNGNNLKLINGPRLPNYAGDLRNKPGKLFAKILAETNSEYATHHGQAGIFFRKIANELGIPAQDWWNIFVLSDTRIKASESDISIYEFELPQNVGKIYLTATLHWRNTWPGLTKIKGFKLKEDILIKRHLEI